MKMSWDWVTGFFDADGSAYKDNSNNVYVLAFSNNNVKVLNLIRSFINAGQIVNQDGHYRLIVKRHKSLLRVANEIHLNSIVKKEALKEAIMFTLSRKWSGARKDMACLDLTAFYEKMSEMTKENKNYERGRAFEYRVMKVLRQRGFHCMRRFGSHDENVEGIGKVPIDVSAFGNGIYLMVSCKYSIKGPTGVSDDPKWRNLAAYAKRFNAVPVLACIDEKRHVKFIDLRDETFPDLFYRFKAPKQDMDQEQIERLVKVNWELINLCDEMIKNAEDSKIKNKWANTKVTAINVLQRILWRAGLVGGGDDITKLFEDLEEGEKKTEVKQDDK